MMFTDLQLKFILQKKTELIKKTEPSINEVIVEFLKKYDVNIESATIQEINLGTGLKGGLIGVAKKKAQVEDWTKWKQWALDHKEFPKFQTDLLNEVHEYNKNIDKKFEDPEYQKNVLNPLLKAQEKSLKLIKGLIFIVLGLAIIGNIYIYLEDKNDQSSLIKKY